MNRPTHNARLRGQARLLYKTLTVSALIAKFAVAADTDPFAGQWRYRPSLSERHETYKIRSVGEGKYQTDNGLGAGPVLPVDGSPQETPQGGTVTLKKIDERTYLFTLKRQSLYKRTITIDGDTMKWAEDQETDSGKHQIFESDWKRVGKGTGLAGEWHLAARREPQADQAIITIKPIRNGLKTSSSNGKREEEVYFDGKEHPQTDPDDVNGITYVAKRLNPHSYRLSESRKGQVIDTVTCQLSADENSVTCTVIDSHGQKNVVIEERVSR